MRTIIFTLTIFTPLQLQSGIGKIDLTHENTRDILWVEYNDSTTKGTSHREEIEIEEICNLVQNAKKSDYAFLLVYYAANKPEAFTQHNMQQLIHKKKHFLQNASFSSKLLFNFPHAKGDFSCSLSTEKEESFFTIDASAHNNILSSVFILAGMLENEELKDIFRSFLEEKYCNKNIVVFLQKTIWELSAPKRTLNVEHFEDLCGKYKTECSFNILEQFLKR